jgi:ABC-type transport system substrate-binding protein
MPPVVDGPAPDADRRGLLSGAAALALAGIAPGAWCASTATATGPRVLRYAFQVAETGFDPARITDIYSRTVTPHIFEALYGYDPLARPAAIVPLTAAAMPEVSADFREWTVPLRPGIFFADDPAFGGKRRELVAQDYVYSIKRFADPAIKCPTWTAVEDAGIVGLSALRRQALDSRSAFDYDREIDGLRAVGRHTVVFRLENPRPRLLELLATGDLLGAVAREVVEHYGERIAEHPVGTGPFMLTQWRRSSRIVLERNPTYRERVYDARPAADDAEGQAWLARFRGRRLPMLDRVEIAIIEESQPRWLSFLNGEQDFIERVPPEFIQVALPQGRVAPNLARRGVKGLRIVGPEVGLTMYNMENAVIGGYTPERVALRRALNLSMDVAREIRLVRRGQGIPAQGPCVPHTTGYDPTFKTEMSDHDPARARALLDLYGYVDRNGDGWREQPDGSPLVIERSTQPDQLTRQQDEVVRKSYNDIGVRVRFLPAKWPENLKAAQAGRLMSWGVGSSASQPDGQNALQRLYGPASGGANLARFKLDAFDAVYRRMQNLPDGPERMGLFRDAIRLAVAYAPYKQHLYRMITDMAHPQLVGYRRPLFWQDWWHVVDIDHDAGGGPHG